MRAQAKTTIREQLYRSDVAYMPYFEALWATLPPAFVDELTELLSGEAQGRLNNPNLSWALQSAYHSLKAAPEALRIARKAANKKVVETTVPLLHGEDGSLNAAGRVIDDMRTYYATPGNDTWIYAGGAAGPSLIQAPIAGAKELMGISAAITPVGASLSSLASTAGIFGAADAGDSLLRTWKEKREKRRKQQEQRE